MDVAKRLMDYGFHAPTVSFPVPGTLMVEPTESEPKEELDRFWRRCSLFSRRSSGGRRPIGPARQSPEECAAHGRGCQRLGLAPRVLREQAAYPVAALRQYKFWPPVSRIDNPFGDRNLFCSCPPTEAYAEPTVG